MHCKRHFWENEETTDLCKMFAKPLFEKLFESRAQNFKNSTIWKWKISNKIEHKFEQTLPQRRYTDSK